MSVRVNNVEHQETKNPGDSALQGIRTKARLATIGRRLCCTAGLLVIGSISAGCSFLSVEEPPFEVLSQHKQFEVRQYHGQLVAEARTSGNQKEAANRGFRLLADFIFGNNTKADKIAMTAPVAQTDGSGKDEASQKIAMTAPVAQVRESQKIDMTAALAQVAENDGSRAGESSEEPGWVIRFTMPTEFTLETLPKPNNPAVVIREIPGRTMAVMKFSGYARIKTVEKKRTALTEAVAQAGLTMQQDVELAQYNPPWIPGFLRRNEVMVQIESEN